MVRASFSIWSTRATYSSWSPGFRRERKTVTIMSIFPRRLSAPQRRNYFIWLGPAGASSLLVVLRHRVEPGHPGPRRAPPLLPPRGEVVTLAQDADPHRIGRLHAFAWRRRIDRRGAFAAKRLDARLAAVRSGLHIDGRLPRHLERAAGDRDRDAERGARGGLAIGAMANLRPLRIGLAFDLDGAARAPAVDFHDTLPFVSSAACSIAA